MADLDDLYAQVPDVGCKGLCVDSCGSVAMSPEERRRIAERGVHLPLLAAFVGHCPALRNGRCSVYEVRPMVCRLWGAVEGMKCRFGRVRFLDLWHEGEVPSRVWGCDRRAGRTADEARVGGTALDAIKRRANAARKAAA
jgi:Fe-S-cluster containining protein